MSKQSSDNNAIQYNTIHDEVSVIVLTKDRAGNWGAESVWPFALTTNVDAKSKQLI